MPKWTGYHDLHDATRQEVIDALLHTDRARHDELGRTVAIGEPAELSRSSSPREQPAAPIDLTNVDE